MIDARTRRTRGRPRRDFLVAALAALALLAPVAQAAAQAAPRTSADPWRPTRIAKWTLLAVAAGFGVYAIRENARAEDAYEALRRRCDRDPGLCQVQGGEYTDAESEQLYDRANTLDRRAQVGILAGEGALLGSAAFFILDLRHGGSPENIPYDPNGRRRASLRIGVRLPLPVARP